LAGAQRKMECRDIRFRISEWVDGELKETEITEVETHVNLCQACCHVYDDFRNLKVTSLDLPVFEPSERVWSNIHSHLVLEGLSKKKPEYNFWEKLFSLRFSARFTPAFGMATFLLAVLVFGSIIYLYNKTREPSSVAVTNEVETIRQLQGAELHYQKAIQALDEASRHKIQSVEPRMAQILNDNLATIDYYVKECQDAAHSSPGNPLIQKYLLAAYQKKAELLQSIVNSDVL
jgi:hypothetical protein